MENRLVELVLDQEICVKEPLEHLRRVKVSHFAGLLFLMSSKALFENTSPPQLDGILE